MSCVLFCSPVLNHYLRTDLDIIAALKLVSLLSLITFQAQCNSPLYWTAKNVGLRLFLKLRHCWCKFVGTISAYELRYRGISNNSAPCCYMSQQVVTCWILFFLFITEFSFLSRLVTTGIRARLTLSSLEIDPAASSKHIST